MRDCFKRYVFPFERIYSSDYLSDENNYVTFKNNETKRMIRHVDGKIISIIGYIYNSLKYYLNFIF